MTHSQRSTTLSRQIHILIKLELTATKTIVDVISLFKHCDFHDTCWVKLNLQYMYCEKFLLQKSTSQLRSWWSFVIFNGALPGSYQNLNISTATEIWTTPRIKQIHGIMDKEKKTSNIFWTVLYFFTCFILYLQWHFLQIVTVTVGIYPRWLQKLHSFEKVYSQLMAMEMHLYRITFERTDRHFKRNDSHLWVFYHKKSYSWVILKGAWSDFLQWKFLFKWCIIT